ncbi:DUF3653 domain-containing protein [Vibrio hannami]|uniref:DUF3653 domain-containing protein n=1 Tax=Vibrio hannami TaxID=2717094 RepID=UPI00241019F9|nr:DUF3653 domain-containing protein [Vibrio hannami]MDG3085476.1 DUF3653 domain-containing protein [Vibrio hannami]
MNRTELTKNLVFRKFVCGLSVKDTAKLCLESESEIKKWDEGKTIPPICKRLMRMVKGRELHHSKEWDGFWIEGDTLRLPNGERLTSTQILSGNLILKWDVAKTPCDKKILTTMLRTARNIARLDNRIIKR